MNVTEWEVKLLKFARKITEINFSRLAALYKEHEVLMRDSASKRSIYLRENMSKTHH